MIDFGRDVQRSLVQPPVLIIKSRAYSKLDEVPSGPGDAHQARTEDSQVPLENLSST